MQRFILGVAIVGALAFGLAGPAAPSTLAATLTHEQRAINMGFRALADYATKPYARTDFYAGLRQWSWEYNTTMPNGSTFTGIVWVCGDEECQAGQVVDPTGAKSFFTGT